jgi:hypothetical protein
LTRWKTNGQEKEIQDQAADAAALLAVVSGFSPVKFAEEHLVKGAFQVFFHL